jgi:hypothetical protein
VHAAALAVPASVALLHLLRLFPPVLFLGLLRLSSKRRLHDLQDTGTCVATQYSAVHLANKARHMCKNACPALAQHMEASDMQDTCMWVSDGQIHVSWR